ncbi:MAG: hypothetical protein ACXVJT_18655 [Thermoanaerobaculia bacterium]
MPGEERKGSYAESREQQSEFEGLVREEGGDWNEAVKDVEKGEEPDEEQPRPPQDHPERRH